MSTTTALCLYFSQVDCTITRAIHRLAPYLLLRLDAQPLLDKVVTRPVISIPVQDLDAGWLFRTTQAPKTCVYDLVCAVERTGMTVQGGMAMIMISTGDFAS